LVGKINAFISILRSWIPDRSAKGRIRRGGPTRRPSGRTAPLFALLISSLLIASSLEAKGKISKPVFPIKDPGLEFPVDYEKYGVFSRIGTPRYRYKIKDRSGLAEAVGSGIYPNSTSIRKDPKYIRWAKKNKKPGSAWDYVNTGDPQSEFYVWATTGGMGPGAKLFFTAKALADAHHYQHALKAYYAVLIHFPGEPVWSADHSFVWYVGPNALSQIESITTHHPEVGVRLDGGICDITNGKDTNLSNDVVMVDPGRWVPNVPHERVDLSQLKIINRRGEGKIRLVQYENKHWQLLVNNRPFVVRGLSYKPTPVGLHVAGGVGNKWMTSDENNNGKPDSPYDSWVDWNGNGRQNSKDKAVGDFQIMKDMGGNAIRLFRGSSSLEYDPKEFNKEVLRDLFESYGIRVIMGDYLGAYTVGSGALWDDGTDYKDPEQLENMRSLVRAYVKDHRNEPYVLMWLLGNENLMPSQYEGVNATRTRAAQQTQEYLEFVNEIAEMIHQLDPNHPVAVGNLDLINIEEHAKYAPAVDIFGVNSYRGTGGFGSLWKEVRRKFDRPVLVTEYGCDAFDSRINEENEKAQAAYHKGNWMDIELQLAGGPREGNALGGIVFEYLDEWWKSSSGAWDYHDTNQDSPMAFPDGWSSEEWFGIFSQGEGGKSPYLRKPRKAYFLYRNKLWKNYERF